MEIKGMVQKVYPVVEGTNERTGMQWRSQGVVIVHGTAYSPANLYATVRNQKIDELNLTPGKKGTFNVFAYSETYTDRNGVERWSTKVNLSNFKEQYDQQETEASNEQAAPVEDPLGIIRQPDDLSF